MFRISRHVEVPSHTIVYRPNDHMILHIPYHCHPARPIDAYMRTDRQSEIATTQCESLVANGAYLCVCLRYCPWFCLADAASNISYRTRRGGEVLCCAVYSSILLFGAVISLVFGTMLSSYRCDICDSIQAIQIL